MRKKSVAWQQVVLLHDPQKPPAFMEVRVLKFLKITHLERYLEPTWRGRLRHSKQSWLPYLWDSATHSTGNTEERGMNHRHRLGFLHQSVAWKGVGNTVKEDKYLDPADTYNLRETLNQGL